MSQEKVYPQKKIDQIKEIEELFKSYSMIGLTNLEGISSNVLQRIRKSLRGDTELKIAKNTLKRIAINNTKTSNPKLNKLLEHINGNTGLIFSKKSPFALQKYFNANRVSVSARAGQKCTDDIWVSGGPTEMSPGPVIGELNSIGIRTSVEGGKIKITKDTKVLTAGETITETHVSIFSKLGIKPMKMGIALNLALEESGEILLEKDLNINFDGILADVMKASIEATNLSVGIAFPTKENIGLLLSKAASQATLFS